MNSSEDSYPTIESVVGETPLVRLQRLARGSNNHVLCKLEGNNPAGSVKDRPALSMIAEAEARGDIRPGDTLIEATSGNTGIALAMAAAIRGYRLRLIMPAHMSSERKLAMAAYGAELIQVSREEGMEGARDLAEAMQSRGEGTVLNQFGNFDNPLAHYRGTGPEIWRQTRGEVTHFISSMGTTGTIMGVSAFLKEKNPEIQIIGLQPKDGSQIPGIRRWSEAYRPTIFQSAKVDRTIDISQSESERMMRRLAVEEGIFAGVSSGGSVSAALQVNQEVEGATIVAIVCDRGDRYLSTGVYGT
ncbi:cysteine synthase CysM [Luminiphilus sp.]|nr:cysteine synthase CysM [Luminiphilus sp.]MDA8658649.1 cysteine synthase CysM [Luminiphilus sp.]MDA9848425.1 cysteine synthase CysM [Luminiphilus sp.]MDB2352029.1 cysteine synthase CysM [Luminiphilus sp.]MDC3405747.1 cysteine synthase CysM [Luminiphilus sp.]